MLEKMPALSLATRPSAKVASPLICLCLWPASCFDRLALRLLLTSYILRRMFSLTRRLGPHNSYVRNSFAYLGSIAITFVVSVSQSVTTKYFVFALYD